MQQPIVAAQLYVWMQHFHSREEDISDHLDRVFAAMKEAGFDAAEGWLDMIPTSEDADLMRKRLEAFGLRFCSVYQGGAYHSRELAEKTFRETVEKARSIPRSGCSMLNVNPNPIGREKTDEELTIQCEYLNRVGKALQEKGVRLVIHNHDVEIRNGARELHANCAGADPAYVGLCLDLDWIRRGGEDAISLLKQYLTRVDSLHIRNSVNGIWPEAFGEGDIDYGEVASILNEASYQGPLIVELAYESPLLQELKALKESDAFRRILENLRRSREYTQEVFGV